LILFYDDNFYCAFGVHWVPKGQAVLDRGGRLLCPVHRKRLRLRVHLSTKNYRLRKKAKQLEVQTKACDVRGKVFCALSDVRGDAFLAVEGCLKFFGAVFRGVFAWEKSMLSALGFLTTTDVDAGVLIFTVANGAVFHE